MPYRNYTVLGLELIEEWGASAPFRMNRLITALEDFAGGGPATQAAPDVDEAEAKIFLVPPRPILRGVADAAALVLVDRRAKTVEIIEVINDYFEASEQDWLDLRTRAERALQSHGRPDGKQ
jgi:hypothetical protein